MDPLPPKSPPGGGPLPLKNDETLVEPISPQEKRVGQIALTSLKPPEADLPELSLPGAVKSPLPSPTPQKLPAFKNPPGSRKNFDLIFIELKIPGPRSSETKAILRTEFRAFWESPKFGISKKTAIEMQWVAEQLGEHEIASTISAHLKDFDEELKAAKAELTEGD